MVIDSRETWTHNACEESMRRNVFGGNSGEWKSYTPVMNSEFQQLRVYSGSQLTRNRFEIRVSNEDAKSNPTRTKRKRLEKKHEKRDKEKKD